MLNKLPEQEKIDKATIPNLTFSQVRKDFTVVIAFMNKYKYITVIYSSFIFIMIFTFAMDAQEVVFTQRVIGLSETEYSLVVSITGVGSVTGGVILAMITNYISLRFMIVIGVVLSSIGYVIYAFSWSFLSITVGFVILGFFLVFLNAGITTFYQNNIPVNVMGRVTSIFQLIQSALQVLFVLGVGVVGDFIPLRQTIGFLAITMLVFTLLFAIAVLNSNFKKYYDET